MRVQTDHLFSYLLEAPDKLVLSNPRKKTETYKKIVIRKLDKGYLAEQYTDKQVFHENIPFSELESFLNRIPFHNYKQLDMWDLSAEHHILIGKDGDLHWTKKQLQENVKMQAKTANREKKYLIPEGTVVAPLVDLGIFTAEGKIVRTMYDKYRQINRFLEMLDDEAGKLAGDETLHIIDFGCGKSYLTFIVYYYFTEIRKQNVHIVGLDLKADVIEHCNEAAAKYGYKNLRFEVGDINGYKADFPVDLVMTLHACDTATDYALFNAIMWDAKLILSVPCCQHEVNKQMTSDELHILTRYGIVKERTAALMTDAIRANLLHCCGYKAQILEFVDLSHTPKNLLIRASKTKIPEPVRKQYLKEAEQLMNAFQLSPCLYRLLKDDIHEMHKNRID